MTSALPDPKPNVESKPTIYPDYCHTLSPTIGKWVPLCARDIHALKHVGVFCDERVLYHFKNHPIKWVKVTGIVVAVDEYEERKVYALDDSSGLCVECTAVAPQSAKTEGVSLRVPRHLNQLAAIEEQAVKFEKGKKGKEREDVKTGERREKKTPSVQDPVVPWDAIDVGTIVKVKGRIRSWWNEIQVEVIKVEVLRGLDAEVKCWDEVREFRDSVLERPWVVSKEEEEKCRKVREKELRRAKKQAREERGKDTKGKSSTERRERELKRPGDRQGNQPVQRGVKWDERDVEVKKRKDLERVQKLDGVIKRRKEENSEGLGSKNKINYPSLAFRKAAAGKYDALGI